jgi:chemotaxis protein MotB
MKLYESIKRALSTEGGPKGSERQQEEFRAIKDEFAAFKERSESKHDELERQRVYIEEAHAALKKDFTASEKRCHDLENSLDFQVSRYDQLEAERDRLIQYYKDNKIGGGAESIDWRDRSNGFEKSRLIRSKDRDEEIDSNSNWLISYGDAMTLLLAVFIMFFSFAAANLQDSNKKYSSISDLLRSGDPVGELYNSQTQDVTEADTGPVISSQINFLRDEILRTFEDLDVGESLLVAVKKQGVEITLRNRVTFNEGGVELAEYTKYVLSELANVLGLNPGYDVLVEGHTDNLPISSVKYPSNWELSAARASAVVRYLTVEGRLDPARISAAGYGEHRPVESNLTEAGRAANRRVILKLIAK